LTADSRKRFLRARERAEKLICIYLRQIKRRRLYTHFGFENIYDYALERFGFCFSKTRALLFLGKRLGQLPTLTEALAKGRIGWTKAAKVASVATSETDAEWTEKAIASSFRDLEREVRDGVSPSGGRISIWLSAEQAAIWQQALEICRRVSGEEIDSGLALEYIAGEFLATYAAPTQELACDESPDAELENAENTGDGADSRPSPSSTGLGEEAIAEIDPKVETRLCPDNEDLPSIEAKCYATIHREVLDRDGFRCQYPGCSVRYALHVHHLELRSHFGRRTRAQMNDPSNLVVLCAIHHRMLHAGIIGVRGKAPGELEWRRPKLMETATERHERIAPIADAAPFGASDTACA
jgi:hypothetical protein